MFAFLAGILPAIILVIYIYLLDKNQREPIPWIVKAFCYGMIAVLPILFFEKTLSEFAPAAGTLSRAHYDAFLVAGVCEEGMKLLFLWLLLRKNPYFDERMDCIVYAVCVSMGFAAVENVGYLVSNLDQLTQVAISRAFMSVPAHFFFAVFMGYFMSLAIWGRPQLKRINWILTFLVPVALHGIYDVCLMSMPISEDTVVLASSIFLALGIFVWVGGHRRINRVLFHDKNNMPQAMLNPLKHEGIYNKDEKYTAATSYNSSTSYESPTVDASSPSIPETHQYDHQASTVEPTHETHIFENGFIRRLFSFNGRINRKEYAISFFIYLIWYSMINDESKSTTTEIISLLAAIPVLWFYIAQGCKRCHDLNHSGFWLFIPFYFIWLLFQEGDPTTNEYGEKP